MTARNTILDALLALAASSGPYLTTGRRLMLWTQVKAQPALFLRHTRDAFPPRPTGMPAKVTMECELWIYSQLGKDKATAPDIGLNDLLDQVERALLPPPTQRAQTLGGLCTHAWIEGTIDLYPGDLDGQAIAVVPVHILVPSIQGS